MGLSPACGISYYDGAISKPTGAQDPREYLNYDDNKIIGVKSNVEIPATLVDWIGNEIQAGAFLKRSN